MFIIMDNRLPHNGKESFLYGGLICLITVMVMLILNIGSSFGRIDIGVLREVLKLAPIVWLIAMIVEGLIVGKIADKLVTIFSDPADGFNARILFTILFCVTGMSSLMTIIGGWLGEGKICLEPFLTFFGHWPRNFFVAFWCEVLLAQPFARLVMKRIHLRKKILKVEDSNDED